MATKGPKITGQYLDYKALYKTELFKSEIQYFLPWNRMLNKVVENRQTGKAGRQKSKGIQMKTGDEIGNERFISVYKAPK